MGAMRRLASFRVVTWLAMVAGTAGLVTAIIAADAQTPRPPAAAATTIAVDAVPGSVPTAPDTADPPAPSGPAGPASAGAPGLTGPTEAAGLSEPTGPPGPATPPPPPTGPELPPGAPPTTLPEPVPPPLIDPVGAHCFGAADTDSSAPCENPRLTGTVFPTPAGAFAAQRSEGCRRSQNIGLLRVCFWGAPATSATRTVALIGDSHASHWRAALQRVVEAKRWRAISISRAACPLTLARPDLPGAERKDGCQAWNQQVQRWVAQSTSISVVFTAAHRGRVLPSGGQTPAAARTTGYTLAWRRLLVNGVGDIVVIRDTPRISNAALTCVSDAIARRLAAGRRCALPRRYALPPDPVTEAALILGSARVQVADLSSFFCSPTRCPPVVGGALVLRDVSHMTTTFSTTLGPYLLRAVDRLKGRWQPPR